MNFVKLTLEFLIKINGTDRHFDKTLSEQCPNTEFFLVCIFLYSDQKKLRIWTFFK